MKKGLITLLMLSVWSLFPVIGQDWEWKVKSCSYLMGGVKYEVEVDKIIYQEKVLKVLHSDGEIEKFEGEFRENIDGEFEMMSSNGETLDYFVYQPNATSMTRMHALKMNLSSGRYYLFELEK